MENQNLDSLIRSESYLQKIVKFGLINLKPRFIT
jgi:hypothetical protein